MCLVLDWYKLSILLDGNVVISVLVLQWLADHLVMQRYINTHVQYMYIYYMYTHMYICVCQILQLSFVY